MRALSGSGLPIKQSFPASSVKVKWETQKGASTGSGANGRLGSGANGRVGAASESGKLKRQVGAASGSGEWERERQVGAASGSGKWVLTASWVASSTVGSSMRASSLL